MNRTYLSFIFFIFLKVAFSQTNVKAVKGDGIYTLLKKNNYPASYFKQFVKLNKSKLGKNNMLFIGKTYTLPKKKSEKKFISTTVSYPIFGEKHKNVNIKSDTLKGTVYYLVSGHGGPDPGAMTTYKKTSISEDEYAYDVTLRLARELIANGAMVYLIIKDTNDGIRNGEILKIDHDEVNHPNKKIPLNQLKRLKQRTETTNTLYKQHKGKYQRIIAIHVDSRSKKKNIDVFFYHHKNSKNGKRLAKSIYKSFKEKYKKHQPNRKYTGTVGERTDLYLIKNTLAPTAYIELGNIKNSKDQKRILNYENRDALAKWIFEGILTDYHTK